MYHPICDIVFLSDACQNMQHSVSGSVSSAAGSTIGMLAGGIGGNAINATLGSSTAPIEVSGTVNGTAIAADNALSLLCGAGYDSSVHKINYVIK